MIWQPSFGSSLWFQPGTRLTGS